MLTSQVTIKVQNGDRQRQVWFFFESDHEDLADLNDALVEEGTVFGHRLESEPAPGGSRRITSRYDFIVSSDAVVTICPPQYEIIKEDAQ